MVTRRSLPGSVGPTDKAVREKALNQQSIHAVTCGDEARVLNRGSWHFGVTLRPPQFGECMRMHVKCLREHLHVHTFQ